MVEAHIKLEDPAREGDSHILRKQTGESVQAEFSFDVSEKTLHIQTENPGYYKLSVFYNAMGIIRTYNVWVGEELNSGGLEYYGVRSGSGGTGPQGPKGDTGPTGPQGVQGPEGPRGSTGPKGDQGVQGPQGIKGDTGPAGPRGSEGPQGERGPKGEKGDDGTGGSPEAIGEWLSEQGSIPYLASHAIAKEAAIEKYQESYQQLSVLDFGAIQSDQIDSAPAIQAAINAIASEIISSVSRVSRTLFIPGGKYQLNSTIIQPPYVKIIAEGTVVFETYVADGPAWWITPLATDPNNIGGAYQGVLAKQQWNWGTILGASGGAIVFSNRIEPVTGTTALELGAREELGALKPLSRYEVSDIAIQKYDLAVKWNAYRHYICTYRRFHIELCREGVRYGDGVNVLDSGEKVSWIDSLFGSSLDSTGAAHYVNCDTINLQFYNCSFDFLSTLLYFSDKSTHQRADFFGGHIEGINSASRYAETNGVVVSKKTTSPYPEVSFHGVPFVVPRRGTLFKGRMNLKLDGDYRVPSGDTVTLDYQRGYLTDELVRVLKNELRQWENKILVSRHLNMIKDPTFKTQAVGTDSRSIAGWTVSAGEGVTGELVNTGPRTGDKALALTINPLGYRRFTSNSKIAIRPGEILVTTVAFNVSSADSRALNISPSAVFYDSEGAVISTSEIYAYARGSNVGEWSFPIASREIVAPPGAFTAKVQWDVSSPDGTAGVPQLISDFSAWVEK